MVIALLITPCLSDPHHLKITCDSHTEIKAYNVYPYTDWHYANLHLLISSFFSIWLAPPQKSVWFDVALPKHRRTPSSTLRWSSASWWKWDVRAVMRCEPGLCTPCIGSFNHCSILPSTSKIMIRPTSVLSSQVICNIILMNVQAISKTCSYGLHKGARWRTGK